MDKGRDDLVENKPNVAFICVHNSCRSQIAEAISKKLAADTFNAYSAGTELKREINPDAVAVVKELYQMDMTKTQRPKLLAELPAVDVVITMGCNVECPFIPAKMREDWALEDPTGKPKAEFIRTAKLIEEHVLNLREKLKRTQW